MPIHNDPSGAASKEVIVLRFKSGVFDSLNTVKFTPSKRASPSVVANQRYPSAVCAMARTESCGNPFEVVQTSWPSCVRASLGPVPRRGHTTGPIANRLAGCSLTTSYRPRRANLHKNISRRQSPPMHGKQIPDIKVVESMAASSASHSRGSRWLHLALRVLAIVFAAATVLYTYFWMVAFRSEQPPAVELGLDFPYQPSQHANVVTNVCPVVRPKQRD